MKTLHVEAVDVVDGGVVVTYDDASCAFYEEEVLMTHLAETLERKETGGGDGSGACDARAAGLGGDAGIELGVVVEMIFDDFVAFAGASFEAVADR